MHVYNLYWENSTEVFTYVQQQSVHVTCENYIYFNCRHIPTYFKTWFCVVILHYCNLT